LSTLRTRAHETLGIEPGADLREIRAAYRRLARIYHPDRFVDAPADVAEESQRRMKIVSAAYSLLRAPEKPAARRRRADSGTQDPWKEARAYREAIHQRKRRDAEAEARWRLWEQLENEARERARLDAAQAAAWADEEEAAAGTTEEQLTRRRPSEAPPPQRKRTMLEIRLAQARGDQNALTVRYEDAEDPKAVTSPKRKVTPKRRATPRAKSS
jgi:curved DNA-binding protein CbpA